MKQSAVLVCLVCCFVASLAFAQDFNAAAETILPESVRLGMAVGDVKQSRPTTFEGPPVPLPGSQDTKTYRTLMEVQNVGAPGHLSYWYLCAHERVVGVLRTKSLIGIDPKSAKSDGQQTYTQLAQQLGSARQETLLRKGRTAFVPVRADVWRSKEGTAIYFIATDHEITIAIVKATDFPLAQVFIKPDSQRFPIEEFNKRTIVDLQRPTVAAWEPSALKNSPASVPIPTSEASFRHSKVKATPLSSPVAKLNRPSTSQQVMPWNVNRILIFVLTGIVIVAIAAVLIRRSKP